MRQALDRDCVDIFRNEGVISRIEQRPVELGLELPPVNPPLNSFQSVALAAGLAFVAGQAPTIGAERPFLGRLGAELTTAGHQAATRLSLLNVVAQMRAALDGDLDRIVPCVKLGTFVNSAPDFKEQPQVANGASDLMVALMGEPGRHAGFAIGTIGPMDFACSVEAIFQVA